MITIHNTDCIDYMKSMKAESVDHIIMDPPYGTLGKHVIETNIDKDILFSECFRIAKKDSFMVAFVPSQTIDEWVGSARKAGYKPKELITWHKRRASNPFLKILRVTEYLYIFAKGKIKWEKTITKFQDSTLWKMYYGDLKPQSLSRCLNYFDTHLKNYCEGKSINDLSDRVSIKPYFHKQINILKKLVTHKDVVANHFKTNRNITTFWNFDKPNQSTNNAKNFPDHPTIKPVALYEQIIQLISKEGDVIFDPFLGSGTIAYAIQKHHRSLIATELNKDYFNKCTNWLTKNQISHSVEPSS